MSRKYKKAIAILEQLARECAELADTHPHTAPVMRLEQHRYRTQAATLSPSDEPRIRRIIRRYPALAGLIRDRVHAHT